MGKMSLNRQVYLALQEVNLSNDVDKRGKIYDEEKAKIYTETELDKMSNSNRDKMGQHITKVDFKKMKDNEGNRMSEKYIFSHTGIINSISQCKDFVHWLQDNHGVRMLSDITPELTTKWLEHKQENGVATNTLKTYKYALHKLSEGIESKGWGEGFYTKEVKDFYCGESIPSERQLTNKQVEQIINYANENGYKWKDALTLQSALGLRVEELVKLRISDIHLGIDKTVETQKWGNQHLQGNYIYIYQSKGGLSRWCEIPDKYLPLVKSLSEGMGGKERIFEGFNRNLYDKFLGRITEKLYGTPTYSSHEIRKYWASSQYEIRLELAREEKQGELTYKEKTAIMNEICSTLGHGDGRKDLQKIYIMSAF